MDAPLYLQLAQRLSQHIAQGTFAPGEQFPSVRQLMKTHQISMSTAVQVCHTLEDWGLLQARPRSGYYVDAAPRAGLSRASEALPTRRLTQPDSFTGLHATIARWLDLLEATPPRINFMTGVGAPELYPTAALQRLAASALRQHPEVMTQMTRRYGHPDFLAVLAKRAATRGMQLRADQITVTNGAIEALTLALRALCQPGDTVAVESPTFYGALQALEALGLRPLELPTSPSTGLSVEALAMALDDPRTPIRALLCMPTLHNPLGCTMPDAHKRAVLQLCGEHGVPIIEDDIYADMGAAASHCQPIKAMDETGLVIHCSSLNKSLAPGMRIGWMSAGRWQARVEMLKYSQSRFPEELGQIVLARFLASKSHDRYLRRLQQDLRERRQALADEVARCFGDQVKLTPPDGGLFLWLELPAGVSAMQLGHDALARGIHIAPGPLFSGQPRMDRFVRLSAGMASRADITDGMRSLSELMAQQLQPPGGGAMH
ncbi:hypothetical protein CCO03_07575 [Comamonas serinivorans]|uniref:HTH gntR-type domain-containing protein n=1 Tax=Comamonas serinivorans TaxID=1082851 RepID=A0A1Y0ELM3_9BURK|nr:PLP-dependent aminotransferase family protein [Comamonas serinivorans]ARU04555.1 hypothetical protein CCO03_07575 [Comamonas serinivorans]